ncbi:uncharacterized protein LOC113333070 [Papaver somniferum]|uniref:uncharacterized protein LOC113333070 n=1 Tax=Papaver somniferum TaxID=3469 RepID=UPI000E6F5578|nr:uncharacterized protein LOC113333070 [Papaver somniferum]
METLVIAQHRSQYYGGSSSRSYQGSSDGFGGSSSPSSSGCFRGINCRTFHQSGGGVGGSAGILPTPSPFKSFNPDFHQSFSSPKTPKSVKNPNFDEETKFTSSSPPITISCIKDRHFSSDDFTCCSELWAGPAYSNSPPPSSLPLPKFSLRPKRSVSLPVSSSDEKIEMIHQFAKSAPPSPTRELAKLDKNDIFESIDFATKDLCRILNLDIGKND